VSGKDRKMHINHISRHDSNKDEYLGGKNICDVVQHCEDTLACQGFTLQFPDLCPRGPTWSFLIQCPNTHQKACLFWKENVLLSWR